MKYVSLLKGFFFIGVFLFGVSFLSSVSAFQAVSGDNVTVSNKVFGDIYIVGSKVTIDAPIDGDLTVLAGEVHINAKITGDINVIAGKVTVNGDSGDDIRAIAGEIRIERATGGDVLLMGSNIYVGDPALITGGLYVYGGDIENQGTISGDMYLNAQNINFDGTVFGNTYIRSEGNLNVSKEARIRGDLTYSSYVKNTNLEVGTNGKKQYTSIDSQVSKELRNSRDSYFLSTLYSVLFLVGFGAFFYFYFEKFFFEVQRELLASPLRNFLLGFALYIGLPIFSIILFVTIIGIPFGFLGICAYIFLFLFAKLFVVVVFTASFIQRLGGYKKLTFIKKLGILFATSLVFGIIPYLAFILSFFVYGAITTKKYEILEKIR